MIEHYQSLIDDFDFSAPRAASGRARVHTRTRLGIWIGRKQKLYVAGAQPLLLSSEYDGIALTTHSVVKPFVWLTLERRLVVVEGSRLVFTELEALVNESLLEDKARWLEIGLRQDVVAMTQECARHRQTATLGISYT